MLAKVGDRRRHGTGDVEPAVIVEALIFDGEDGVDEVRRNVGERGVHPLLFEDAEHQVIVVVVNRGRLVHLPDPGDGFFVRQPR